MAKRLSTLLSKINCLERNNGDNPEIEGLAYNSTAIQNGYLFFACKGEHVDGHSYIDDAVSRGCRAVIHSDTLSHYDSHVVYIRVGNSRKTISPVSAAFYDHPSSQLPVLGVTGTNGKSTTVFFIHQLLEMMGVRTGVISTVYHKTGDKVTENPYRLGTPEGSEVQMLLRTMVNNRVEAAIVEATSHGLSERNNRLGDVDFAAAVLTNVTHEHLEFHGTLERYIKDKSNLFRYLNAHQSELAFGIINADDPNGDVFRSATEKPIYTYGIDSHADLRAIAIRDDAIGADFSIEWKGAAKPARINVPARFNISNALAAVITVSMFKKIEPFALVGLLPELAPVKGRMQVLDMGQPFKLVIDYAHSPDAFTKILPHFRSETAGKLISVFGSAGERDTEKRSAQGAIASEFCDIVLLTDEDPRAEDRMSILEDIASGCRNMSRENNLFLVPDRREAIQKAFGLAGEDDTVLLLGKSHESSIIYAATSISWDEIEVARQCLQELLTNGWWN
jgi:UDP-N-acetylmuramoyl-L-alanyl-D-glutamate--2,6-diaminopimelate ligase